MRLRAPAAPAPSRPLSRSRHRSPNGRAKNQHKMAAATRHSGSRAPRSRAPPARSLSARVLLPGPLRRAAERSGDRSR